MAAKSFDPKAKPSWVEDNKKARIAARARAASDARKPAEKQPLPIQAILQFGALFLLIFGIIAVNDNHNVLMQLGITPTIAAIVVCAWLITGLMFSRGPYLIILVVGLVFLANVSPEFAMKLGYNRDYIVATLVSVLVTPLAVRAFQ